MPTDPLQDLGHLVIEQCPPGFAKAVLEAEIDDDWAQMKIVYIMPGDQAGEADFPAVAAAEIHESLDAIWQEMARQSGQRWSTCVFTVDADGRFKLDVAY
ncbi:MAG TPA: hypothetical protein VEX35_14335 [Allosphingosinicella sp.]|nr:hypothetical protein [Allosphingosinicella sp.]